MPTRVEKILKSARITLADLANERWTDETLIELLNEGLTDFAQRTQMLHERINVPIIVGNPYFSLPDNCWELTRVLYDNAPIPLVTHQELDVMTTTNDFTDFGPSALGSRWEETTGEPLAIIYDRRDMLVGKVYPIPDKAISTIDYSFEGTNSETLFDVDVYGVTTGIVDGTLISNYGVASSAGDLTQEVTLTPDYGVVATYTFVSEEAVGEFGVIVDLTGYEFNSVYGTVVDLFDTDVAEETFNEVYGFVDTISEATSYLTCYYLRNPGTIEDIDSTIDTPQMYDYILKFYVCAQAFLNDLDTGDQAKGTQQLGIYENNVKRAKKDSSKSFTRASQFITTYRSGF